MPYTAGDALLKQIATFQAAIDELGAAIDDITGSTDDPETATWADVARYAHLVDALARADIVG